MVVRTADALAALYTEDETAWLDATAELIRRRELAAVDFDNLSEYLTDMASSERREVRSRLVQLLMHLLKWQHQPAKRTRSWRTSVIVQQQELRQHAGRGVLRAHAIDVLPDAYADAIELAMSETSLPRTAFPADCPYTLDQLFTIDLPPIDGE